MLCLYVLRDHKAAGQAEREQEEAQADHLKQHALHRLQRYGALCCRGCRVAVQPAVTHPQCARLHGGQRQYAVGQRGTGDVSREQPAVELYAGGGARCQHPDCQAEQRCREHPAGNCPNGLA